MAAASASPAWASSETLSVAATAARLCKADLASSTVTEMTALAGTMGRHYAYKQVGSQRDVQLPVLSVWKIFTSSNQQPELYIV